ncbi:MAG: T9SS type A sorting domain-containing protein [Bacteroidota bacterium]
MKHFLHTIFLGILLIFYSHHSMQGAVIISGILDGTQFGGEPKAIELYISGNENLAFYEIERAANGGAFGATTSLSGIYTDQFVYLVSDAAEFAAVFGTAGDFANVLDLGGVISGNGNDAFRILEIATGTVIDQVAPVGSTDIYEDSYLYRNNNTGPDGGWTAANWTQPGNNVLDGLTPAQTATTVPFGTFTTTSQTTLYFNPTSVSLEETGGTYDLCVSISQPSTTVATTADVGIQVGSTGGAADINAYITTQVTFPAASSVDQCITLNITNDLLVEGVEFITFELTNIGGGISAAAGTNDEFELTLKDDDIGGLRLLTGFFNPCGEETQNEYLIAQNVGTALDVDDITIASIDPLTGAQPNVNYQWNTAGTLAPGNTAACAIVGNQCNEILDINVPADATDITALVNSLNTQAACGFNLFVAPTGANGGSIPANANVIVFLGAGGNGNMIGPGFDDLSDGGNLDFDGFCGLGPVYVLFGRHQNSLTATGFFSNQEIRTYRLYANTLISDDITYPIPSSTQEAELVLADGTYLSNQPCTPTFIFLPVTLSTFEVIATPEGHGLLQWVTASEENSHFFEVQRSQTGRDFSPIGEVAAAGNASEEVSYEFIDANPFPSISYYRLKMVDLDGQFEYSPVVQLRTDGYNSFSLLQAFPSPADQQVSFQVNIPSPGPLNLSIFSTDGRIIQHSVHDLMSGIHELTQDVQDQPRGIYLYRMSFNGEVISGRFLKR